MGHPHSPHQRNLKWDIYSKKSPKARVLRDFRYDATLWQQLQTDIRRSHLDADVEVVRQTLYGTRYEIHAPLYTPSGRVLMVKTIWQIDEGMDFPRFITLFPD
jgi:hypothetical protein